MKENDRAVVLAAVNPLLEAQPWANLRKQAAEIELPLFERVASSVVAGEFDEVESIKKYEAASASCDYRKGEPRRRTFIGAVLIDGATNLASQRCHKFQSGTFGVVSFNPAAIISHT